MLAGILSEIVDDRSTVVERDKGIAFLMAAREIYRLSDIWYLCVNIPRFSSGSFVHCAFSGDMASQAITSRAVPMHRLAEIRTVEMACRQSDGNQLLTGDAPSGAVQLTSRRGEFAILGFRSAPGGDDLDNEIAPELSELKILGEYFHCHMLRRNGVDTSEALVVSARELDCLRWVAAGKSAWEASIILGISERTVRFHLNSAREKLNCITTTQAVAKAVAQQLIAV
ncbi:transcriptional activator protein [Hyphomicrobium denitrificans 1NES1]|uniref:Transcriptional activator protein n=1 Tax=Hyphomicrobium denitrificans 1NES1 TaxID=670307 RepID=N0BFA5_9HYPH|nr:helix-turn-helix transcriptional regulator [Hyphomicrobium denitrificans]AGK59121.1 transcriptional activator protein [Hyphomicrobium denitrificans 1NES1]